MVFISFISHSDYRVAHAAYKVLKAVTVRDIDRFEKFIAKNDLVLIQILKMSNPIVYADLMKLLARFIEVNIPSQVNSDGFFAVPNYVPISFKMMNNFLIAADLLPKTVISILKNVPKSSDLCTRSSQCLYVLRSVLQKRTTVAKLLLQ